MTAEQLAGTAGVVLSLIFSYVPSLNTWYGGQSKLVKRLVMIVLLAIVAGGAYGLTCAGLGTFLGITLVCDTEGALVLINVFFQAALLNQATYLLSPTPKAVEAAKAARVG